MKRTHAKKSLSVLQQLHGGKDRIVPDPKLLKYSEKWVNSDTTSLWS